MCHILWYYYYCGSIPQSLLQEARPVRHLSSNVPQLRRSISAAVPLHNFLCPRPCHNTWRWCGGESSNVNSMYWEKFAIRRCHCTRCTLISPQMIALSVSASASVPASAFAFYLWERVRQVGWGRSSGHTISQSLNRSVESLPYDLYPCPSVSVCVSVCVCVINVRK